MIIDINNQWLVAIIGGAIAAVLSGIIIYYLFDYGKEKITKKMLITSVNIADKSIDKNKKSIRLRNTLWIMPQSRRCRKL